MLDGGMGTQLQAAGLPVGQLPELWNLTEPEKVTAVHRRYVEAGSRVLYTNTFGVNGLKAARFGHSVSELVKAGVRCARAADRGEGIRVALDIGPLGQILEPLGTLRFEEAYELFREIVIAGRDAGADLIVIDHERSVRGQGSRPRREGEQLPAGLDHDDLRGLGPQLCRHHGFGHGSDPELSRG